MFKSEIHKQLARIKTSRDFNIDEAIHFAFNANNCDKRMDTERTYILHPLEAAAIITTITDDKNVIAAELLYGVVEDNDLTGYKSYQLQHG